MALSDASGPRPDLVAARRTGERRADVLHAIAGAREGLGVRALAEATGLHDNTVRFHLERLVADGLVERRQGRSPGPGRPPLVFVARRDQDGAGHDNYELIAGALAMHLGDGEEAMVAAEAAGRAWGRSHAGSAGSPGSPGHAGGPDRADAPAGDWEAGLDELVRVMDGAGFAPEITDAADGATVRVHHCPFGNLAREDRTVPCAVHLGLMRGVAEVAGGAVRVEGLEPFVTPSLCLAHLAPAAARSS
ncbi:helix-turn-helix transcriptional regulator [Ornithinimicrobium avium]|uniref:GntR family transcriptional regulator n=1 Tax=Ornithinimicrobium avium TaxID=2283195 RepID=A0A345NNU3_9MICO|nr:helix-turn-helix domain-containing protein [Ornithinimicrobium avium]AXH96701.1 GntR family transcriptional regulator [Ornithinimicrobium avium]